MLQSSQGVARPQHEDDTHIKVLQCYTVQRERFLGQCPVTDQTLQFLRDTNMKNINRENNNSIYLTLLALYSAVFQIYHNDL